MIIHEYPAGWLDNKSLKVKKFDAILAELVDEMKITLRSTGGSSLSAIQCGCALRVIVTDNGTEQLVLINPVIQASKGEQYIAESCLSLPFEPPMMIKRPAELTIGYRDVQGKPQRVVASGVLAGILMHEIDHCNGVMPHSHIPGYELMPVGKVMEVAA